MADTTYTDFVAPTVNAAWLNEINDHVWHDTPVSGTTVHNSSLIGFTQSGTGAVLRTSQDKMRDFVSVKDFGATGDGITNDTAAIQAAYDAVTTGGVVNWTNNSYKITSPIVITKAVTTEFNGATVTQTGTGNAFTMATANQTSAAFSLGFRGGRLLGNAKTAGSVGIAVSNNNPFVYIEDIEIRAFDLGIKLADAYCSKITNTKAIGNNVGIELQGAVHASTVINAFCEANTTAGLRLNYGGGFGSTHNLTIQGGAFQTGAVGIWLEGAYEPNIINPYFEGNTNIDLRLGVADAGVYARATYNAKVTTLQSTSPCSTGANNTNVMIEHSVGIDIDGAGFYSATPTKHVSVDTFSDNVNIDYWKTTLASPWDLPTGNDAHRCTLSQNGRSLMPYDPAAIDSATSAGHLRWGNLNTGVSSFSQRWGSGLSSRDSLIIEAHANASDLLLKAKAAQGQIRFADSANLEHFSVDMINGRINCYKPIIMKEYTVATLPATGAYSRAFVTDANATTFNSIVAGGGANKVPVFHDGTNWRIG